MSETRPEDATLFGIEREQYGTEDLYREHLLEQYKVLAQFTDSHFNHLSSINRFFLTVNLAVVSGVLWLVREGTGVDPFLRALIGLFPTGMCVVWWLTLRSSRRLSSSRMAILQDIERSLPVMPFRYEWTETLGSGTKYLRIQVLRQAVPWFFVALYLGLAAWVVPAARTSVAEGTRVRVFYDSVSGSGGASLEGALRSWDRDWVVVRTDEDAVCYIDADGVGFVRVLEEE